MPQGLCTLREVDSVGGKWVVFRGTETTPTKPNGPVVSDNLCKFLKQLIKRQPEPVLVETLPGIYKVCSHGNCVVMVTRGGSFSYSIMGLPGLF